MIPAQRVIYYTGHHPQTLVYTKIESCISMPAEIECSFYNDSDLLRKWTRNAISANADFLKENKIA